MDFPPTDYRQLFDTIVQVAGHDETGSLVYRVELVDRYHDGPHVPSSLGVSPLFTDLSEAVGWATRAIEAFKSAGDF